MHIPALLLIVTWALLTISGCQTNKANSFQPLASSGNSANANSSNETATLATSESAGPPQEKRFCALIRNEPIEAKRLEDEQMERRKRFPLQKSDEKAGTYVAREKMFDDLYTLIGPSGNFTGWRGSFSAIRTREAQLVNQNPYAPVKDIIRVTFTPDCLMHYQDNGGVSFTTYWNPPNGTDIVPDSPLGQALQQMNVSQGQYTISGQFFWYPKPGNSGIARYHFFLLNDSYTPDLGNVVGYLFLIKLTETPH